MRGKYWVTHYLCAPTRSVHLFSVGGAVQAREKMRLDVFNRAMQNPRFSREQKMLNGHLPRVIYHHAYFSVLSHISPSILWCTDINTSRTWGECTFCFAATSFFACDTALTCRVSGFGFIAVEFSGFGFRASGFGFRIPGFSFQFSVLFGSRSGGWN